MRAAICDDRAEDAAFVGKLLTEWSGTRGQEVRWEVFPSAEELALSHAERDAIIEGILALGDPDARILICRYYLCMRTSEIAQLTGLKENTVDQRARRALKKLSAQLDEGGIRNAESAL